MKCYHCDRPAMFVMEPAEGVKFPLCLDCHTRFVQVTVLKNDMLERSMNFLLGMAEAKVGLPGVLPRFPQRLFQAGSLTLNNINISDSAIGILNTGHIQTVDGAITVLKESGSQEAAAAIVALSHALAEATDLEDRIKKEAFELLSILSTEAIAPKDRQRPGAMRTLLAQLSRLLGDAASLSQVWQQAKAAFEALFGATLTGGP